MKELVEFIEWKNKDYIQFQSVNAIGNVDTGRSEEAKKGVRILTQHLKQSVPLSLETKNGTYLIDIVPYYNSRHKKALFGARKQKSVN